MMCSAALYCLGWGRGGFRLTIDSRGLPVPTRINKHHLDEGLGGALGSQSGWWELGLGLSLGPRAHVPRSSYVAQKGGMVGAWVP